MKVRTEGYMTHVTRSNRKANERRKLLSRAKNILRGAFHYLDADTLRLMKVGEGRSLMVPEPLMPAVEAAFNKHLEEIRQRAKDRESYRNANRGEYAGVPARIVRTAKAARSGASFFTSLILPIFARRRRMA